MVASDAEDVVCRWRSRGEAAGVNCGIRSSIFTIGSGVHEFECAGGPNVLGLLLGRPGIMSRFVLSCPRCGVIERGSELKSKGG
jgi:hypothetical protein